MATSLDWVIGKMNESGFQRVNSESTDDCFACLRKNKCDSVFVIAGRHSYAPYRMAGDKFDGLEAVEIAVGPCLARVMCNDYEQHVTHADYVRAINALELAAGEDDAAALQQADDIRIGDFGPVLRAEGNGVRLERMRFGFPPPRPKAGPVFNFKSDGRSFAESRRCVIVLSGFFEFTGRKYPKTKHRLALKGSPVMGIAGLWSEDKDGTMSFTMLTTEPGPDIAGIHDRQVCVLPPEDWAAWLFLTRPEAELLAPLPAGSLVVKVVREGKD